MLKKHGLFAIYFFLITIGTNLPHAMAIDPLISAIQSSSSAMQAQSERLRIITENIANEDSTGLTPGATPYRRKVIFLKNTTDPQTGAKKVVVSRYDTDNSDFKKIYDPTHPAADNQGYVLYPNVDKLIESADAKEAQLSYEANLGVMQITRSMMEKTIETLK